MKMGLGTFLLAHLISEELKYYALLHEDAEWSEYIHVLLSGEDVVGVRIALFVVLACVRNHYVRTLLYTPYTLATSRLTVKCEVGRFFRSFSDLSSPVLQGSSRLFFVKNLSRCIG